MKQLLSISKQRKKQQPKKLIPHQPEQNQQHNFIYEDYDDNSGQEFQQLPGPTQQQIRTYANILGIKLPQQQDLLYLAKQCLNQPMPSEWRCQEDQHGEIIYVNSKNGQISFQHPCDQIYKSKVIAQRKKKISNIKKSLPKINAAKSKTNFIQSVFKPKLGQQGQFELQSDKRQEVKLDKLRKAKDLQNVINQNIKISQNSKFLQDNDFEPVNSVISHSNIQKKQSKNKISNLQVQVGKQKNNQKIQFKQNLLKNQKSLKNISEKREMVKIDSFKKIKNKQLLQRRKKQAQQKIRAKYEMMTKQLDNKHKNKLISMKYEQDELRKLDFNQVRDIIGQSRIQKCKKQIQTRLMLQHTVQLDKKRSEAERQYRNNIVKLTSQYQIQNLFTQMAQCRKVIEQLQKKGDDSQNLHYLDQMQQNMNVINKMDIDKAIAQINQECTQLMNKKIQQAISNANKSGKYQLGWELRQKITYQFLSQVQSIIQKVKQKNHIEVDSIYKNRNQEHKNTNIQKQSQIKQSLGIYQQMSSLKMKLLELQQQNKTQRSNLSDKQSKLYQLLQNRVTNSARPQSR